MANIKKLKANGQDIVPITHEQAVLDSNGVTLDSKLNAINNAISRLENNSTSNTPSLVGNALTFGNYTIKYNETDDTLDFIYNGGTGGGTPEEPTTGVISLSWIDNKNIDYQGVENNDTTAIITDYLTKEDAYNYTINLTDVTSVKIYFYDSSKTFISRTNDLTVNSTDILIEFPENTSYFRIKSDKGTATVDNANNYIIIKKVKKTNGYVTDGLSMYIDGTRNSINDITGNHTITNHGVTHTSDNNYLNFVASESDYLDTDFVPNLSTWSAELYFYFTEAPTSSQVILGWGSTGENKFRIAYSKSYLGLVTQSNIALTRVISTESNLLEPHHLIVTKNNGVVISYLDGVKTELCTDDPNQSSHAGTLKIGTKYDASTEFANINLRTFRFYDGKVLTDEEASQNYNYEINRADNIIKPTWIDNMKLDTSTGSETAANKDACTNFISYDNSYEYTLAIDTVTFFRVYYYDSSQSYIKNDSIADNFNGVINPPENTAYMRLKLNKQTVEFADLDNHVIFRKTHK